jgi:L-rhamnose mutarotase
MAHQVIALHSISGDDRLDLREGAVDTLVGSVSHVGIHEWTVWCCGRHLFHLLVCDDASAAMSALADESADPDRDLQIGPFVELFLDAAGEPGFAPLHGVPDLAHRGPAAP